MKIAVLCSAHGFGHLTRQLAIAEELMRHGAQPVFFTAAPPSMVTAYLPEAQVRPWVIDVGIQQQDSLTEDLPRTLTLLEERDVVEVLTATPSSPGTSWRGLGKAAKRDAKGKMMDMVRLG